MVRKWEVVPEPQNVSEAARLRGVSHDTIYRHRKLIKEGGVQALKRQVRTEHYHQNRTDQEIANTVIEFSLDNPHLGQAQMFVSGGESGSGLSPGGQPVWKLGDGQIDKCPHGIGEPPNTLI